MAIFSLPVEGREEEPKARREKLGDWPGHNGRATHGERATVEETAANVLFSSPLSNGLGLCMLKRDRIDCCR